MSLYLLPSSCVGTEASLGVGVDQVYASLNSELDRCWVDGGSDFMTDVLKRHDLEHLKLPATFLTGYRQRCHAIPKDLEEWQEKKLYDPMVDLISYIIAHYHGGSGHQVVNTSNMAYKYALATQRGTELRASPSLSIFDRQYFISGDFQDEIGYRNLVTPVEATLEYDKNNSRLQQAVYARQIFCTQDSRRYVYSLVYTQSSFRLLQFDRGGCVLSDWVNYRKRPHAFTKVVLAVCSLDPRLLGYQESISWDPNLEYEYARTITVKQSTGDNTYTVEDSFGRPFFHRRAICGRGTVCWDVSLGDARYVVKDMWRAANRRPEHELLVQAAGLAGVGQLHAYEDGIDSISALRFGKYVVSGAGEVQDRTLSRVVLRRYGMDISYCKSRKQLLTAFRDAVAGHRNLLLERGILHRDISVMNILLGDEHDVGNRGLVIDLDMGIEVDRLIRQHRAGSSKRVGTRTFQSYKVLLEADELGHHDHMDDLEAFFYVLCWVCAGTEGCGKPRAPLPSELNEWETQRTAALAIMKRIFMMDELDLPISECFGPLCYRLLEDLRKFFTPRINAAKAATLHRNPVPFPGIDAMEYDMAAAREDYRKFLEIVDQYIKELEDTFPDEKDLPDPWLKVQDISMTTSIAAELETVSSGEENTAVGVANPGDHKRGRELSDTTAVNSHPDAPEAKKQRRTTNAAECCS